MREMTQDNLLVTNTGLNIPEYCSEDEFMAIGRTLAAIESGHQWAVGDWYNAIKGTDRVAACEAVGINPDTARRCAQISRAYKKDHRWSFLSFKHHEVVAPMDPAEREKLLIEADNHQWTTARLRVEKKKREGTYEEMPAFRLNTDVENFLNSLPKNVSGKVRKKLAELFKAQQHEFESIVLREVKQRTANSRQAMEESKAEYDRLADVVARRNQGLSAYMTLDEYKLIRSCLHPDKQPEAVREKYNKAFNIFVGLEETVKGAWRPDMKVVKN